MVVHLSELDNLVVPEIPSHNDFHLLVKLVEILAFFLQQMADLPDEGGVAVLLAFVEGVALLGGLGGKCEEVAARTVVAAVEHLNNSAYLQQPKPSYYFITMLALLSMKQVANIRVWQALQSYKGSEAQRKFHSRFRDEQELKAIKAGIDYATINKNSKGRFMFREFLFQQKVEQNYIAPLDCEMIPLGRWTRRQLTELLKDAPKTISEAENDSIIESCQSNFEQIFRDYYNRVGKKGYKFILSEEIGKLSRMSEEQFSNFVTVLGKDYQKLLAEIVKTRKV